EPARGPREVNVRAAAMSAAGRSPRPPAREAPARAGALPHPELAGHWRLAPAPIRARAVVTSDVRLLRHLPTFESSLVDHTFKSERASPLDDHEPRSYVRSAKPSGGIRANCSDRTLLDGIRRHFRERPDRSVASSRHQQLAGSGRPVARLV